MRGDLLHVHRHLPADQPSTPTVLARRAVSLGAGFAGGELEDLGLVLRPVHPRVPREPPELDGAAAERDLDARVAQVARVARDAGVAGDGRRRDAEDLVVARLAVRGDVGGRARAGAWLERNFTAIGANLPSAPALMGNTVVWKPAATAARVRCSCGAPA